MTNQEALDKIEALLRARKDTDPKARIAWEAITVRVPEGAIFGLLDHDICESLEWEPDYWLLAPGAWRARIIQQRGSPWQEGATRNAALAAAIIAALEAKSE